MHVTVTRTRGSTDQPIEVATLAGEEMLPWLRQIEGFEAAIKEDRSQQYASAFNAANHFAQAGNLDRAKPLLEISAKDPALADLVAQLRKIIGG